MLDPTTFPPILAAAPGPWRNDEGDICAANGVMFTIAHPSDSPCFTPDTDEEEAEAIEQWESLCDLVAASRALYESNVTMLNALAYMYVRSKTDLESISLIVQIHSLYTAFLPELSELKPGSVEASTALIQYAIRLAYTSASIANGEGEGDNA